MSKPAAWLACAAMVVAGQSAAAQDSPRFRAGVDLVPIDVTVVDQQGRPVRDLAPEDFKVTIDGAVRRVQSAEWISLIPSQPQPEAPPVEGFRSNAQATGGRLIVLAIDQANIRFGGGRALAGTIERFLDHLSSSDRIALVGLGRGTASIPFTGDRERIKQAVAGMNGQLRPPTTTPAFRVTSVPFGSGSRYTREQRHHGDAAPELHRIGLPKRSRGVRSRNRPPGERNRPQRHRTPGCDNPLTR